MATLSELHAWHQKLADLYLMSADKEVSKKYKNEAARQERICEEQTALWNANPKNITAKNKAREAELAARQALHLSVVAGASSSAKAYVTHRLVAVQIDAQIKKTSPEQAVRAEITRLLHHADLAVASAALAHPNSALVLTAEKAA